MVSVSYNKIWKWVTVDWTTLINFYGEDFNPTQPPFPSWWSSVWVTSSTTSFDLDWFQPWHEVWTGVIVLGSSSDYEAELYGDFERYDGSWSISWYFSWNMYISWWAKWAGYIYFWVDDDEIRPTYTKYRMHYYTQNWDVDVYSPEFTVTNLLIDSNTYNSGYLWVEWNHLCYIDGTWSGIEWYKHRIAYDSSYSSSVGSSNRGYIRLDSWDNLRIYYVDADWTKRRTYSSDARYDGNVNVGSNNKWYMWVADWGMEDWYGHLCFVAPNWSKRRILNWPPAWHT